MAFVLGAFWAGMTGTLFAAKMTIISPSSFTFWDSVLLFAAVILGGGSLTGVILGAFLVFGLPEIFRDFAQARMLVFGLALMIMMIIRPQGILPPAPRRYDVSGFFASRRSGAAETWPAGGSALNGPDDGTDAKPEGGRGAS